MRCRDYEIVAYAYANDGATSQSVAEHFGITQRTLRTYVKRINESLGSCAQIVSSARFGMRLQVHDHAGLHRWMGSAAKHAGGGAPKERVAYLLHDLLTRTDWITLDELSEAMYTSRTTLSADVKRVEKRLGEFGLSIERRPRYGMRVTGSELARRLCLASSAVESVRRDPTSGLSSLMDTTADAPSLKVIARHVDEALIDGQYHLNSLLYQNLLAHIAIAIMRIRNGCYVPAESLADIDLTGRPEYRVAQRLAHEIGCDFSIDFPVSEVTYMAIHLSGKQVLLRPGGSDGDNVVISDEVWDVVSDMLEVVRRVYDFDFRDDLELRMNLACHIVPLSMRLRFNMPIENPVLHDTKSHYPLAYAMATDASASLVTRYEATMSDAEIGYIALAFALALERHRTELPKKRILLVCASGLGSARMLEYRCRQEFGSYIESMATVDVNHIDQIDFSHVDYVFTTVPIPQTLPVPVREVSLFLDAGDVDSVRRALTLERGRAPALWERFDQELFFPHCAETTREGVLNLLCNAMSQHGRVSGLLRELVAKREEVVSTALGNGVAMPHPLEAVCARTVVAVAVLDEPVQWGAELVSAVFLIAVSTEGVDEIGDFYGQLANVLMNEQALKRLMDDPRWEILLGLLQEFG